MKTFIVFALLWLVLAIIGAEIGNLLLNSADLNEFTEKGIPIYGKVTAKEPENHQTVRYIYEVNGKQFDGAGSAGRGNPPFNEIQIGQKLVVFYNPESPEKAILGYPQMYAGSNRGGIIFCAIILPIFITIPVIAVYLLYRKLNIKADLTAGII
jgi:hypothetical protein